MERQRENDKGRNKENEAFVMSAHSAMAKFAFTEDALCCILFNRFVFCLTSEAVCSSSSRFFFGFNNLQVTHDVIYKALGKLVCRKWFKRALFPAGHLIHFHRQWFSICNIQFSLWTAQFFHSGRLFVRSFVRSAGRLFELCTTLANR